jgi:hypothetical protein
MAGTSWTEKIEVRPEPRGGVAADGGQASAGKRARGLARSQGAFPGIWWLSQKVFFFGLMNDFWAKLLTVVAMGH